MRRHAGFTLIVLAIIGLLIRGVMAGWNLIRTAELRKVHRQYEGFALAANTFATQYQCLPTDCHHIVFYTRPRIAG